VSSPPPRDRFRLFIRAVHTLEHLGITLPVGVVLLRQFAPAGVNLVPRRRRGKAQDGPAVRRRGPTVSESEGVVEFVPGPARLLFLPARLLLSPAFRLLRLALTNFVSESFLLSLLLQSVGRERLDAGLARFRCYLPNLRENPLAVPDEETPLVTVGIIPPVLHPPVDHVPPGCEGERLLHAAGAQDRETTEYLLPRLALDSLRLHQQRRPGDASWAGVLAVQRRPVMLDALMPDASGLDDVAVHVLDPAGAVLVKQLHLLVAGDGLLPPDDEHIPAPELPHEEKGHRPGQLAKLLGMSQQALAALAVEALRSYLKGKRAGEPVWAGAWQPDAAIMLRADLTDAGIPHVQPGPDGDEFLDFHGLWHTFVARLDRAGVSLKIASELARHSTVELTAKIYARPRLKDLSGAVNLLDGLPRQPAKAVNG
jgi:hypothetical protein